MGFLEAGTPLAWSDSLEFVQYVREHGIQQFINTYNRVKGRTNDVLKWGDEIEYHLVELRDFGGKRESRLALLGPEVLAQLAAEDAAESQRAASPPSPSSARAAAPWGHGCWHPEYGSWMVEATPGHPYGDDAEALAQVEANMAYRRARITSAAATVLRSRLASSVPPDGHGGSTPEQVVAALLRQGAGGGECTAPASSAGGLRLVPFSCVTYPLMGVGRSFTVPSLPSNPPGGPFSASAYLPDSTISPHPRFGTLTANIRHRRGRKVEIQVPLFEDERTVMGAVTHLDDNAWAPGQQQQQVQRGGGCGNSNSNSSTHAGGAPDGGCVGRQWHSAAARGRPSPSSCGGGGGCGPSPLSQAVAVPAQPSGAAPLGVSLEELAGRSDAAPSAAIDRLTRVLARRQPARGDGSSSPSPSSAPGTPGSSASAYEDVGPATVASPGCVHMDAMGFGMGCCCLQVTFQARDLAESRTLYDLLVVVAPLMMALTANAPIWRGRLADSDTRWDVISASVDCRTPVERGEVGQREADDALARATQQQGQQQQGDACVVVPSPSSSSSSSSSVVLPSWMSHPHAYRAAGAGRTVLPKSRYSSVDCFIDNRPGIAGSPDGTNRYNDLPVVVCPSGAATLRGAGLDPALATHVAALFTRDPLVIFADRTTDVDDARSSEHFENVQSTNWRSVRWKPPPPEVLPPPSGAGDGDSGGGVGSPRSVGGGMGWRVELRTMEAQLTDVENAAFTVFTVLLSRALLLSRANLYVPMSAVEDNFARAGARGAVTTQRFFFRRHVWGHTRGGTENGSSDSAAESATDADAFDELTLAEIVCGPERSARKLAAQGGSASAGVASGSGGAAAPSPSSSSSSSGECGGGGAGCAPSPSPPCPGWGSPSPFPGLVPLVRWYLDLIGLGAGHPTRGALEGYLALVEGRADGSILTGAAWQRQFVATHACYAADSVVGPAIVHDLLATVQTLADTLSAPSSCQGGRTPAVGAAADDGALYSAATALLGRVLADERLGRASSTNTQQGGGGPTHPPAAAAAAGASPGPRSPPPTHHALASQVDQLPAGAGTCGAAGGGLATTTTTTGTPSAAAVARHAPHLTPTSPNRLRGGSLLEELGGAHSGHLQGLLCAAAKK